MYTAEKVQHPQSEATIPNNQELVKPQNNSSVITDSTIKEIQQRGLNLDWAKANCQSVDSKTASELLGYKVWSNGIMLKGANDQIQFKPDKRFRMKDGKLSPKYLTPAGISYDAMLPTYPEHPDFWDDLEYVKKHCWKINGIPCLPLNEGFWKAIALCSHGIPAIAILGVEMGLTSAQSDPQGKRYLVKALERMARAGIGFLIAFDSDCARKKGVVQAQKTLADQLALFGVPIFSISGLWDENEGKGIDDYIQMNGFDQFRDEVLSKAETIEAWKEKHLANLEQQLQKSTHPHSPNEIAKEIAEDYLNKLAFNNETGVWMQYEVEDKGVWSPETENSIRCEINQELEKRKVKFNNQNYVKQVMESLKVHPQIFKRKWPERSPSEILPFHNGVLDIATGQLLEHSPRNYLTWTLPRQHDPEAKDWSQIEQWLDFASLGNLAVKNLLICFANAVLKGRSDLQKFMHLIGLGGAGKGTASRLLIDLIGIENTCSSSAELFCNNRFEPINAYRKRLLLFADEQTLPKDIGNLMKAVGGDLLRGEQKNKPAFQFNFDGMALMISEHPIAQGVKGNGWKRRVISVPMNAKVRDHQRRDLNKEFQPELAAFTNYLLSLDDEFVTETLRGAGSSPISQQSFWQSRIREDSIAAWLNDCIIAEAEASTPIGRDKNEVDKGLIETLFGSYCDYCKRSGLTAKSVTRFSPELIELCQSGLGWDVKRVRTRSATMICGIRLRVEGQDSDLLTHEQTLVESVRSLRGEKTDSVKDEVETETPSEQGCEDCEDLNALSPSSTDPQISSESQSPPVIPEKSPPQPSIAKLTDSQKEEWLARYAKTDKQVWVEHPKYTGLAKPIKPSFKIDGKYEWTVEPVEKVLVLHTVKLSQISIPLSQLGDKIKPISQSNQGKLDI